MDLRKIISKKADKATLPYIISYSQISIIQLKDACFSTIHKIQESLPKLFTVLPLAHLTTTIINSVTKRIPLIFKITLGDIQKLNLLLPAKNIFWKIHSKYNNKMILGIILLAPCILSLVWTT